MGDAAPRAPTCSALYRAAAERGVAFVKGTDFVLEGGENTLRLAYSGVTPEQIDEGVARSPPPTARSGDLRRAPRLAADS